MIEIDIDTDTDIGAYIGSGAVSLHIFFEWMDDCGSLSFKGDLTPGMYKQTAGWDRYAFTKWLHLFTSTTVDISPEIILQMFFWQSKKS